MYIVYKHNLELEKLENVVSVEKNHYIYWANKDRTIQIKAKRDNKSYKFFVSRDDAINWIVKQIEERQAELDSQMEYVKNVLRNEK